MNVYRRIILTLAIWVSALFSFAQNEQVYDIVDTSPTYPGGKEELISYLEKNLKYPFLAAEEGIQGKVSVSFVVEKDGSINDAKVINGVHPLLDKEAIRVVSSMPKWTPGRKSNQIVRTRFIMPVSFKLDAPVVEQSAKFSKIWINQIYEENKCYSDIYADLTVYGMKNQKALIQMKIRDSKGKWIKMEYARKSKDGSYYYERDFVPEYDGTSYNNKMWFLHSNKDLKLKKNKQYELILTIISTKNGDTLAVSSPYSFTAFPRNDPAARSTYTTRTYTPVQNPVYPTFTSRKSSTRTQSRTANVNSTNNTSYTSGNTRTSSSYNSRTSRATHSSSTNSQSKSEQSTKKKCQQCNGAGYKQCRTCDGTGKIKCTQCGGDGQVTSRYLNSHNKMATLNMKCTACNGKGKKNDLVCGGKGTKKCVSCNGKGYY